MGNHIEAMTKAELIRHLREHGATPLSKSALDARPVEQLRGMAREDARDRNGGS
jgi:hypothetical protein